MTPRFIVGACVLLAACGRAGAHPQSGLTQQDSWHRTVSPGGPARRIVSLSPATSELVFALGLGDRLVGRTTWCDWPEAVKQVPSVGNGIGPDVEAIVARRPDLVLVYPSEANRAAVAQLEGLHIPAAVLAQDGIADWRGAVRWVAREAGVPERADSLLSDFDRRLAAEASPDTIRPTVFIAVGSNPPIAIGSRSFVSELVALAGGRNAFDSIAAPSAVVSLEAVVGRNPDAVLVLGPDSVARTVARRPGWSAIPAVRAGRIITVDGSAFDRPSPRLPEAVRLLRAKIDSVRATCGARRAMGRACA